MGWFRGLYVSRIRDEFYSTSNPEVLRFTANVTFCCLPTAHSGSRMPKRGQICSCALSPDRCSCHMEKNVRLHLPDEVLSAPPSPVPIPPRPRNPLQCKLFERPPRTARPPHGAFCRSHADSKEPLPSSSVPRLQAWRAPRSGATWRDAECEVSFTGKPTGPGSARLRVQGGAEGTLLTGSFHVALGVVSVFPAEPTRQPFQESWELYPSAEPFLFKLDEHSSVVYKERDPTSPDTSNLQRLPIFQFFSFST